MIKKITHEISKTRHLRYPFLKFFNILNKIQMNFPFFLIFINKDKINEYLYTYIMGIKLLIR